MRKIQYVLFCAVTAPWMIVQAQTPAPAQKESAAGAVTAETPAAKENEAAPVSNVVTFSQVDSLETGEMQDGRISINLKEVGLQDVIRLFGRLSNANLILPDLGPDIADKRVDINLTNVEWKTALQTILSTYDLELYEQSPESRVYTVQKKQPAEDAPRYTRTFVFKHADIAEATTMLREIVGEAGGQVLGFPQGNSVVVKASQETMNDVEQIIARIDQPRKQVLIEARIMELSDANNKEKGVEFAWENILTGDAGAADNGPAKGDLAFNGLQALTGDYLGLTAGEIGTLTLDSADFDLAIKAIQTIRNSRTVSNPKVIVANGETANIGILTKLPKLQRTLSQTQAAGGGTLTTIEVDQLEDGEDPNTGRKRFVEYEFGIRLAVTPTIYTEDNIAVKIVPIISRKNEEETITSFVGELDGDPVFDTYYAIDEKRVDTTFMLGNRRTAVIGGLTEQKDREFERKIPLLGDIPLLKHLFRYTEDETVQTENIIFVTVALEDEGGFSVDDSVADSLLTRKQMIREENRRILDDREVDLFRETEEARLKNQIGTLEKEAARELEKTAPKPVAAGKDPLQAQVDEIVRKLEQDRRQPVAGREPAPAAVSAVPAGGWVSSDYIRKGRVDTGTTGAQLAVRSGPGKQYEQTGSVSHGMQVTVLKRKKDWLNIELDGAGASWAK